MSSAKKVSSLVQRRSGLFSIKPFIYMNLECYYCRARNLPEVRAVNPKPGPDDKPRRNRGNRPARLALVWRGEKKLSNCHRIQNKHLTRISSEFARHGLLWPIRSSVNRENNCNVVPLHFRRSSSILGHAFQNGKSLKAAEFRRAKIMTRGSRRPFPACRNSCIQIPGLSFRPDAACCGHPRPRDAPSRCARVSSPGAGTAPTR